MAKRHLANIFSKKSFFIYLSILYLCLPRILDNQFFLIISIAFAVLAVFLRDISQASKEYKLINTLIFFYTIWVIISYLMHYTALCALDPLSYITVDGHSVLWGLEGLNQTAIIYLLFPLLLFTAIYLFKDNNTLHKWLCLIPVLFLPSTIVSLYQAYINQGFLNPDPRFIAGISTDASAFGISLFFLLPLCVLGFISYQKFWGKVVFAFLAFIQLWCIVLRGQHTTLIGIFLFFLVLPFIYYWVNSHKSKLYRLKFFGIYFCILFLIVGFGIYEIQNNSVKTSSLLNYFTSYFRYFQGYNEGGAKQVVQEISGIRFKYGEIATKAIMGAPTSGWGPGGFYRILPDTIFKSKKEHLQIHNAANHYLQMSSELGVLGCLFNLLLHLIPLWMAVRIRNKILGREERWAVAIIGSIVVILLSIYITGPHGMAKDVLWIIVVLNAYLYVTALRYGYRFNQINFKMVSVILTVLTLVFAGGTYHSSFGENGYQARQQSDWWPLKYQSGFYAFENWHGEKMRWTTQKAKVRVKADSDLIAFKIVAYPFNSSGPDGLKVTLFINDVLFDEISFINGGIKPTFYYIPFIKNKEVDIRIEVSNTFNPRKMGLSKDSRDLGVAISPISFLQITPKWGIGFYAGETSTDGYLVEKQQNKSLKYRFSGRRASLDLKYDFEKGAAVYLKCFHPDIKDNPVVVTIRNKAKLIYHETFSDNEWRKIQIKSNQLNESSILTFEVNRTWNPKLLQIADDHRDLGLAVALYNDNET